MLQELQIILKDSLRNVVAFLAMTVSAIILHFVGHKLEELGFPAAVTKSTYFLEMLIFFSDFLLLFLTVVRFTSKEAHRLLLEMGVDLPKIVKSFRKDAGGRSGVESGSSETP